jgi:DNA repair protein RecO (recombination protein O)
MHKIYHTDCFVISNRNISEADKIFFLFTRDFGLISAIAKGIRKESSKLRYSLQNNSEVKVSLVKGKEFWRITNAMHIEHYKFSFENHKILNRVNLFLKRIVPPESQDIRLFGIYKSFIGYLLVLDKDLDKIEMGMVLYILHFCGYLEEKEYFKEFIDSNFSEESLNFISKHHKEILSIVNKAIAGSHL